MSFLTDLSTGIKGEQKVIDLLKQCNIVCTSNKTSNYDLYCTWCLYPTTFTIEVKNDIYAYISGNIAIEVFNPRIRRKSGLMITKADLWIQIIDQGVYITDVSLLKTFVLYNKPIKVIKRGGDNNATLHLYAMKHILPVVFIDINKLPVKKMQQVIQRLIKG